MRKGDRWNVNTIREMLAGEHHSQTATTVGYEKEQIKPKNPKPGDVWYETLSNGTVIRWEQMKGYRRRSTQAGLIAKKLKKDLSKFPNCLQDSCPIESGLEHPTRLDLKFAKINGMCSHCTLNYEHQLQIEHKYSEYEKSELLKNAKSFFKDADNNLDETLELLAEDHMITNSDGSSQKIEGNPELANQIREEYTEFKNIVLKRFTEEEE